MIGGSLSQMAVPVLGLVGTTHFLAPQMSLAYSLMVRSLENFPTLAMFLITICNHFWRSWSEPKGYNSINRSFINEDRPSHSLCLVLFKTEVPTHFATVNPVYHSHHGAGLFLDSGCLSSPLCMALVQLGSHPRVLFKALILLVKNYMCIPAKLTLTLP